MAGRRCKNVTSLELSNGVTAGNLGYGRGTAVQIQEERFANHSYRID